MINLVAYDPAWSTKFAVEANEIRRVLGDLALRVEHVGSTAVPGLSAKPVIDVQISVVSLVTLDPYQARLSGLGYVHVPLGDFDRVYPFFQKPADWPCTHHVHLCARGSEQEARHLAFRDYLRAHPDTARQYLELKRSLAEQHTGTTQESRESYSLAKSSFVETVLQTALLGEFTRSDIQFLHRADAPKAASQSLARRSCRTLGVTDMNPSVVAAIVGLISAVIAIVVTGYVGYRRLRNRASFSDSQGLHR